MSDEPQKPRDNGQRDALGRFGAGNNANPGGRAALPPELKEKGPKAWQKIEKLMDSADEAISLKASIWIAERVFGKAAQAVEVVSSTGLLRELLAREAPAVPEHLVPKDDED